MMITSDTLKRFAPKVIDAERPAIALENARVQSSVNSARRLCHFMGQVFVETAGFTVLEENLNYKNPDRLDMIFSAVKGRDDAVALIAKGPEAIANRVYANRLGNGNEASGDGSMRFFATDSPERFARVGAIFLGRPIDTADVELIDLKS